MWCEICGRQIEEWEGAVVHLSCHYEALEEWKKRAEEEWQNGYVEGYRSALDDLLRELSRLGLCPVCEEKVKTVVEMLKSL